MASSQDEESISSEINQASIVEPSGRQSVLERVRSNRQKKNIVSNLFGGKSRGESTKSPSPGVQRVNNTLVTRDQQQQEQPKRFFDISMMEQGADAGNNNNSLEMDKTIVNSDGQAVGKSGATLSEKKLNGTGVASASAITTVNNNLVTSKSSSNLKPDTPDDDGYSLGANLIASSQDPNLYPTTGREKSAAPTRTNWGGARAGSPGSGEPNSGQISPSMDNYSDIHGPSRPKSRQDMPGSSGGGGAAGVGMAYPSSRYNVSNFWKARRILFYRNGDPFFPAVEFRFKPGRDISTLDKLLDKISSRMDLPRGARYIFSMDGDRKTSLDELEDGSSYVVSSFKQFKPASYGKKNGVWYQSPGNQGWGTNRNRKSSVIDADNLPSSSLKPSAGRVIRIINNNDHSVQCRVLLNLRTSQPFEEVLEDLGQVLKMTGAKKMYTNTGQEVRSFSQLRNEFAEVDTFYLSNNSTVPVIPLGPGLVASPIRRSRSRASLTGGPDQNTEKAPLAIRQQRARSKSRPRILYAPDSEVGRPSMAAVSASNIPQDYAMENMKEDPTRVVIRGLRRTFYPPMHHAPVDNSPPDKKLLLTWVHGYRGIDSRRNLWVLPSGELLYYVAAVAVLYDREEENQRHYTGHTEDIMCMDVHPSRELVGSGQRGGRDRKSQAHVRIWSTESLQTLYVFGMGELDTGVLSVAFSQLNGGSYILAVDAGRESILSVWQWQWGHLLGKVATLQEGLSGAAFHPLDDNLLITHGRGHLAFWHRRKDGFFEKTDIIKPPSRTHVTSVQFEPDGDVITADSDGFITVYSVDADGAYFVRMEFEAHNKGISCLVMLSEGTLLSGGERDRKIVAWDSLQNYKKITEIKLPENSGGVRTIYPQRPGRNDGNIYVGTTRNNILEGSLQRRFNQVIFGHGRHLWGLAAHPEDELFATAGHDKNIALWRRHKLIWTSSVGYECISLAFHPFGSALAAGSSEGHLIVINAETGSTMLTLRVCGSPLNCLEYNHIGDMVAIGSQNGVSVVKGKSTSNVVDQANKGSQSPKEEVPASTAAHKWEQASDDNSSSMMMEMEDEEIFELGVDEAEVEVTSLNQMDGPRTIVLQRQNGAFGFTLRHFIVYPPDVQDPVIAKKLEQCGLANFSQPMDTVFVKKVIPKSEADNAGLKEGDRLIAVNGIPVSLQFQFADIVATIQKTPKTLVIQIVPKCYDILQTFFSETAHNPETNQRPQAQQPAVRSTLMPIMNSSSSNCNKRQSEPFSTLQSVSEKHEALYSPLIPIANASNNRNVYAGNGNPMAIVQPRILQNLSQMQFDQQSQQGFKNQFSPSGINTEIKDAILSRLRHQIEQKEEFLKRPNKPLILEPTPQSQQQLNREAAHFQQSNFNFPQPNRLKPDNWTEYGRSLDSMRQQQQSVSQELSDIQSNRFAIREQFFKDRSSTNNAYFSLPTSPYYIQDGQQSNTASFIGSSNSMTEGSSLRSDDNRHMRVIGSSPIPSQGLRIVSERTKQFESGRPLSPDGIDRTALYKSELSRINTKPLVSNVALRRQVFEAKANIDSSWRCSSDDKIKDDKELKSLPAKARSLSVESMKENEKSSGDATAYKNHNKSSNNNNNTLIKKERPKPVRENSYLTAVRSSPEVLPVILRQKVTQRSASDDEERKMRRTSYLKATANEEFHFTSDTDQNSVTTNQDDDEAQQQLKVSYQKWTPPKFTVDIQFLKRIFEEPQAQHNSHDISKDNHTVHASHATKAKALSYFRDNALSDVNIAITKQGILHVKVTLINGRRSHDRNWRQCNAELKRNILKLTLLREGKVSQSPDSSGGTIDLTNFDVTDGNYTKRKNVFRLSSAHYPAACDSECELLLQTQSPQEMADWMGCLKGVSRKDSKTGTECSADVGIQKAEPQRIAAIETMQASTLSSDDNPSPSLAAKAQRKYHFGSRSPSGQSPVTKSRKPQNLQVSSLSPLLNVKEGSDKETNSPKQKSTWKHFVTNQFKKMQPQNDSPTSNVNEGCTLSQCTPSEENFYVPLIVSKCTKIVETKGMSIVGIYRIPGNTAAISNLNELINRNGMDEQTLSDPKWEDVNVVSSLLKLFIRSLSEPIVSNELYGQFIEADKKTDHTQRFQELKDLLGKLPRHNYETLKHLIAHLTLVSENAATNLMEPRNLAIVFGPSIVRKSNDSLEMVVKDMKHQCQIVESLISNKGYFFEDDPMPTAKNKIFHASHNDSGSELPSADFLLENVAKIEPLTKDVHKDSSSRFVANIVQAANRKIRKTAQRRSTSSSMTPDSLSLESMTTSAESKDLHKAKASKLKSNESLAETPRSSGEDDFDSAFTENCENGSSSLTATVTALLDNKLRSLRNSSVESDKDDGNRTQGDTSSTTNTSTISNPRLSVISKMTHLQHPRPLTLGENIPFADESPERPLIQARVKPIRQSLNNTNSSNCEKQQKNADLHSDPSDQSDTDSSTTSNYRERMRSVIRLEDSVLRKVNRILTNLEHLERKYSLNRSLSLNYKSHRSSNNNNECCCANKIDKVRLSLTKDEKTDKNINKRRQLHDTTNTTSNAQAASGNSKYRRHNGSRSIRRRHTIGIAHDYDYNSPTIIKTSDRTSFMTPITN